MDMEKVIKDLDELYRLIYQSNVDGEILGSLHDAIALLKEQEAVNITTDYFDGFGNRTAHCPLCNSRLVWHQNKNYCGECGQAVKWE